MFTSLQNVICINTPPNSPTNTQHNVYLIRLVAP